MSDLNTRIAEWRASLDARLDSKAADELEQFENGLRSPDDNVTVNVNGRWSSLNVLGTDDSC